MTTPPVGRPTKYEPARSPRVISRMPTAWEQENVEPVSRNLAVIVAACAIGSLAIVAVIVYWLVVA